MARTIEARISKLERDMRPGEPLYYTLAQILAYVASVGEGTEEERRRLMGPPTSRVPPPRLADLLYRSDENPDGKPHRFDEHGRAVT